jgi:hypothetical protein
MSLTYGTGGRRRWLGARSRRATRRWWCPRESRAARGWDSTRRSLGLNITVLVLWVYRVTSHSSAARCSRSAEWTWSMSAATRFRLVRQLIRVSGSTDHSNTHCEPATVVMLEASVEVRTPLELLAAANPEGVNQSGELRAEACCPSKAIAPDIIRTHNHGSNHRPPITMIRVSCPACSTVCPRRRFGSWRRKA